MLDVCDVERDLLCHGLLKALSCKSLIHVQYTSEGKDVRCLVTNP